MPSSRGVDRRRILSSYVMRNALAPQVTGLAMSLGGIFNGAIITEKVFGYPGVGTLLVDAVYAGDYGLVLGVTTVSILAVSIGVLLIDLSTRFSIHASRCADAGRPARPPEIQHRVPDRTSCSSRSCSGSRRSSFVSPYPPADVYVVPPDVPPGSAYWFGTTSRGQDVFWQVTVAIRNTLLFGFAVARPEPRPVARDRASWRLQGRAGSTGSSCR